MTTQNPDLVRVQNIPRSYQVVHKDSEIDMIRNEFNIKQKFYYLFVKLVDGMFESIYGSYGHKSESEIYHVFGEVISL